MTFHKLMSEDDGASSCLACGTRWESDDAYDSTPGRTCEDTPSTCAYEGMDNSDGARAHVFEWLAAGRVACLFCGWDGENDDDAPAPYVATINVPGYLPMADEPAMFATAREAWAYLADECTRGEDDSADDDSEAYSDTRELLALLGAEHMWQQTPGTDDVRDWLASHGLARNGTGTIYGATPGYDGAHDLGLSYSVTMVGD